MGFGGFEELGLEGFCRLLARALLAGGAEMDGEGGQRWQPGARGVRVWGLGFRVFLGFRVVVDSRWYLLLPYTLLVGS